MSPDFQRQLDTAFFLAGERCALQTMGTSDGHSSSAIEKSDDWHLECPACTSVSGVHSNQNGFNLGSTLNPDLSCGPLSSSQGRTSTDKVDAMSSFLRQIEKLNLPKVPALQVPTAVLEAAERIGVTLRLTSPSAPEQYELVGNDGPAGYVRVRWGAMSVSYPDAGGDQLYEGSVDGFGGFTDHERGSKLLFALDLISARMMNA